MKAVVLEHARPGDLEALIALEQACFPVPWSEEHFRNAMDPGRGYTLLVLRAARPARLLGYCCFQMVVDEMHVHNVAVHPDARGTGLGRALMATALRVAAGRGARLALLEVRPSNEPALRLYEGLGFHRLATRKGYYSHPPEDALVLRRMDLQGTHGVH